LVDFVQTQRRLALLKVADKAQTHASTVSQIALGKTQPATFGFKKLDQ
jgi:hypothetical protein